MDPSITRELSRLDPDVPFRFGTSHHHHTWARTFHSYPELYIQPQSIEEIQKVVTLARRCRRRIVVVGSGHSPSDLTCSASWMMNLDNFSEILDMNTRSKVVTMQAGIRLKDLIHALRVKGLALPNLGSIVDQSVAGAIATATHGSSLRHGILSQAVEGLKIVLSNGRVVACNADRNPELFRAGLVSLGALGVVVEVTLRAVETFKIEWEQTLLPLEEVIQKWKAGLWTDNEYNRVWWMPYSKRCVWWRANKTDQPDRKPNASWFSGAVGFHIYHNLLYLAQWFPGILPAIEWFMVAVQYGGPATSGVEEGSKGLLMNCLYSQFVNEWAIPLDKGPEAISRLSSWLNGETGSGMPFSSRGLYVHAPIELRVADTSTANPRPYLDNTNADGPTLYLNATLYRPYDRNPPCHERYYEAFEWLMRDLGGRPHWAKNFSTFAGDDTVSMYPDLPAWMRIRNEVDPEGMFFGAWHRRVLMLPSHREKDSGSPQSSYPLEEFCKSTTEKIGKGITWRGYVPGKTLSRQGSDESFDLMHGAEAEKSILFERHEDSEEEKQDRDVDTSIEELNTVQGRLNGMRRRAREDES